MLVMPLRVTVTSIPGRSEPSLVSTTVTPRKMVLLMIGPPG
jgi:hypothetical protein